MSLVSEVLKQAGFIRRKSLLPSIPAITEVARLDGTTQYIALSSPVSILENEDFSIVFNISGTSLAYRGIMEGTDIWCRTLPSDASHNLQLFIGGSYLGVGRTANHNIYDGEFHRIELYRSSGSVYASIDGAEPELLKASLSSSFSIDNLAIYNNNRYSCSIYGFSVSKAGVPTYDIPITNRSQGATQLPTVGDISVDIINYTEDVWEQL